MPSPYDSLIFFASASRIFAPTTLMSMIRALTVSSRSPEKIDKVYCCAICKESFLFKADAVDHTVSTGHKELKIIALS